MSNVVLTIGGREYSMACAAGEEAHIRELGRMIDAKLGTLPDGGAQNDSRSLLFAALLLADELHELRQSAAALGSANAAPVPAAPGLAPGADASPEQLVALAERLEALVDVLGIAA
jgi:cell division protein ZapA